MDREELVDRIMASLRDSVMLMTHEDPVRPEEVDRTSPLFGEEGLFDSVGLVGFLLDVEEAVNDGIDRPISVMDERAFSQSSSPFRTVEHLADFLMILMQEQGSSSRGAS